MVKNRDISLLEDSIGYSFNDSSLIEKSLIHTSYAHENQEIDEQGAVINEKTASNERMEFMGDAILGFMITEYLYDKYSGFSEGRLSVIKAKLVSGTHLASLARKIKLGQYIYLGKGEEGLGGRNRDSILAGAFEALISAIYLDGGIDNARKFILKMYGDDLEKLGMETDHLDYKSRLQKITQASFGRIPSYKVVSETGPDHEKCFKVMVSGIGRLRSTASGSSKKDAEQNAAKDMLQKLK